MTERKNIIGLTTSSLAVLSGQFKMVIITASAVLESHVDICGSGVH